MYKVVYHKKVAKEDIPVLPKREGLAIKKAIENKLSTKPELFGKHLKNVLRNIRSLRVGQYRIVFDIKPKDTIRIIAIIHRSKVYDEALKRIKNP